MYGLRRPQFSIQKKEKKKKKKNAFSARCIDDLNSLPNDLVCIEKLDTFKNRLDVLWRGKRFVTSNIY